MTIPVYIDSTDENYYNKMSTTTTTEQKQNSDKFYDKMHQVSLWTVDLVLTWVRYIGFNDYAKNFVDSKVDGDLLLQLDDVDIQNDLKITNGIHKKRFTRELRKLVKSCDFSDVDKHNVVPFLRDHPHLGDDYLVYAYGLIRSDLSVDLMMRMTDSCLIDALKDVGVRKQVHRQRIAEAVMFESRQAEDRHRPTTLEPNLERSPCDAYICNASPSIHGSKEFASLIAVNLRTHGALVYDKHANMSATCKNFILVLSAGTLNYETLETSDFYQDLIAALDRPDCNVVVVKEAEFQMPDSDKLPERIRRLSSLPNLTWYHEYQKAFMMKLMSLINMDPSMEFQRQTSSKSNSSCSSRSGRSTPDRPVTYHNFWQPHSTTGMITSSPTWISGF